MFVIFCSLIFFLIFSFRDSLSPSLCFTLIWAQQPYASRKKKSVKQSELRDESKANDGQVKLCTVETKRNTRNVCSLWNRHFFGIIFLCFFHFIFRHDRMRGAWFSESDIIIRRHHNGCYVNWRHIIRFSEWRKKKNYEQEICRWHSFFVRFLLLSNKYKSWSWKKEKYLYMNSTKF